MKQVLPRFQRPTIPPLDPHTEEEGEEEGEEEEEEWEGKEVPVRERERLLNIKLRHFCIRWLHMYIYTCMYNEYTQTASYCERERERETKSVHQTRHLCVR